MKNKIHAIPRYAKKAGSTIKNEGFIEVLVLSLLKVQKMQAKNKHSVRIKRKFHSLVKEADVMAANEFPIENVRHKKTNAPYTLNWVMSPPRGGGGHQNIFRFIDAMDARGHKNNVYLYSTSDHISVSEVWRNIADYCRAKNLTIQWLKDVVEPSDILFATGWETAYPVLNLKSHAQKMYFVQDFEPYFYPVGTEYILAENTYKFGFFGITAGGWLAHKLRTEYAMECDNYDFGADPGLYSFQNKGPRKKVFFYARPVTTRRGFELGVMTLTKFHELMPDYEIVLAGWDVSEYAIPFPHQNLKALRLDELNHVYNECAAALVISLTNMSLLPLELLAAGVIPVVNEGKNNSMVSSNKFIRYESTNPTALAIALKEEVERKNLLEYAAEASKSVQNLSWEISCEKFENIIKGRLNGN